ncbi:MAG: helix-turn-helix domain-containing protein, partial [Acidimicrobiales bacterium]
LHKHETAEKCQTPTVGHVDVVVLRWPAERGQVDELRRRRCPRLLLIEEGAPPAPADELEDWIRVPAADADLRARLHELERRAASSRSPSPILDVDGVLRMESAWVSLPPVEARLTAALLERFGAVVSREDLAAAGWPAGAPGRNALDVHMVRLRRRLATVTLAIRTVRSRGYLLESAAPRRQCSLPVSELSSGGV